MTAAPPSSGDGQPTRRLDAALSYISRRYAPVDVPLGRKGPSTPGWQTLRITAATAADHFAGPGNIGLLLGEPSGHLVDVDLDCEEAVRLAPLHLPPTSAITGRASRPRSHWWFICRGAVSRRHTDPLTKKVIAELRATGQTLVGPSLHPTGERYDLLEGEPAVVDAADLGARVSALAEAVRKERQDKSGFQTRAATTPTVPPSAWVLRRAAGYLDKIPAAISGQGGHNQTYAAASAMVHGFALGPDEALALLIERYNPRCQPPWTEPELAHKVHDAATKPHGRPRGWLLNGPPLPVESGRARAGIVAFPLSDLGNAERLVHRWGSDLRYCHAQDQWLVWDKQRWRRDDAGTAIQLAGRTVRAMLEEASVIDDASQRRALAEWALKSEAKARLDAAVALARSQPALVVRPEDLDADPWLLGVTNGTVDLRTGQLLPHDRSHLITRLAPVAYWPGAACPLFAAFVQRIFSADQDLIGFVRRLLGMALTGVVRDQVLPIFHGAGANGKSVLVDTVKAIMGDYAADAPPYLLTETRLAQHPTEIADLYGRRLVIASETEQDTAFRMQLVKRLTGDESLKGRHMRQDFFEFRRTHKLILVTNNAPRVHENSEAVWRRLRRVPFSVVIPPAERDVGLIEKLRAEAEGILAWLVAGCLEWQERGLGEPGAVTASTGAYRATEDTLGRFLEECCEVDPQASGDESRWFVPWRDLLKAYEDWTREAGESPLDGRRLGEALEHRGHGSATRRCGGRTTKGRVGLCLRAAAAQAEQEAST